MGSMRLMGEDLSVFPPLSPRGSAELAERPPRFASFPTTTKTPKKTLDQAPSARYRCVPQLFLQA
ncbi:MAG: hypothetical protein RLZZ522_1850 [Verrucomicrobiota bacterium]